MNSASRGQGSGSSRACCGPGLTEHRGGDIIRWGCGSLLPMTQHRRRQAFLALAWTMLASSFVYLTWRGIERGLVTSFDLTVGFAAGQAWLQGFDPYDPAVLERVLAATSAGADTGNRLASLRNVYVPTTLPLYVPLGLFDWPSARAFMVGLNAVASLGIVFGLCRLLGLWLASPSAIGLIAFVLAFAPLQTSMAIGQSAIIATSLVVAAILLDRSGRPVAAGMAYGLATAAKVQLGLPFLAFQILRARWSTVASGALVVAGLTLVAIARMQVAAVPWVSSWFANLALLSGPGGINDPSTLNPERYSLVNLQYLLGSVGVSPSIADGLTIVIVGVIAVGAVVLARRIPRANELVVLALIAVLSLLVAYHRYYDAVILTLPIAWAVSAWRTGQRILAALVLTLCADFLVPAQTALNTVENRQILPAEFTDGFLWRSVIMTQHVWALVLLAAVLLWAMVKAGGERHGLERAALPAAEAG